MLFLMRAHIKTKGETWPVSYHIHQQDIKWSSYLEKNKNCLFLVKIMENHQCFLESHAVPDCICETGNRLCDDHIFLIYFFNLQRGNLLSIFVLITREWTRGLPSKAPGGFFKGTTEGTSSFPHKLCVPVWGFKPETFQSQAPFFSLWTVTPSNMSFFFLNNDF